MKPVEHFVGVELFGIEDGANERHKSWVLFRLDRGVVLNVKALTAIVIELPRSNRTVAKVDHTVEYR